MMHSETHDFPYLASLLGAYFHQDFNLEGSVDEIIAQYARDCSPEHTWATIADIRRLLFWRKSDVEDAFASLPLSVHPPGWDMTTEQWLRWIERLLVQAAPMPSRDMPPANDR